MSGTEAYNLKLLRLAFRYSELITSDKTEDTAKEPDVPEYLDPTGELAYIGYAFETYHNYSSTYGFAAPMKNKSNKKPDSPWYDL